MMRNAAFVLGLAGGLLACSSDGAGSGEDTLPKRGEMATDPTIVSAVARCSCGGLVCDVGSPQTSHISVRVNASDPMGSNLMSCAGMIGAASDQGGFAGDCRLEIMAPAPCALGQTHTVDLTVANATGGVTTASVNLTVTD